MRFLLFLAFVFASHATIANDSLIYKKFSVAELRADLDSLHYWLESNHPDLYVMISKKQAEANWENARKRIRKPITRLAFLSIVSPLVVQYRDGHTGMWYDFEEAEFKTMAQNNETLFPFFLTAVGRRLFIKNKPLEHKTVKPGDEILAINGKPVIKIIEELIPVTPADDDAYAISTFARLFSFKLWLEYNWKNTFSIQLKHANGAIEHITSHGIKTEQYLQELFTRKPTRGLYLYPEYQTAIIEINSYNEKEKAVKFIDSCFEQIKMHKVKHLALDLRKNGGGNSEIGSYLLSYITRKPFSSVVSRTFKYGPLVQQYPSDHWLKKRMEDHKANGKLVGPDLYRKEFDVSEPVSIAYPQHSYNGKFYLFTSGVTYSSAHMTAMEVKCYKLGTIIGEATHERMDLTSEMQVKKLPNTRLNFALATGFFKAACGQRGEIGVKPDIHIPLTEQHLQKDEDPILQYLFQQIVKE